MIWGREAYVSLFTLMTDTVHKGQKQVVEGSAVGEYYVIPKFAYNCFQQVEYYGEAKVLVEDHANRHFIQKFTYDCVGNIERILIATNKSNVNCDNLDFIPINNTQSKIILNTGDFSEVQEKDAIFLKTGLQTMVGHVLKKNSDSEIIVQHGSGNSYVQELGVIINKDDLTVTFKHDNTKDFAKRRWDHRERYFYKTK